MRQILSQGNMKITMNVDGKQLNDPSEMLHAMEKSQKENIRKDSNKIEPALYP